MTFYSYKIGTSRGQYTYGYNIVSLTNTGTGKRYRANGGGYDMLGSVLGDILTTEYQDALKPLAALFESYCFVNGGSWLSRRKEGAMSPDHYAHYYGGTAYYNPDKSLHHVSLDGACGFSCMQDVARAAGYEIKRVMEKTRRDWKIIGVTIEPLTGEDAETSREARFEGITLAELARRKREANA